MDENILFGKNIIGMENFSPEEIRLVLTKAKEMKQILRNDVKKLPNLHGKSVATLFLENSTRTRTSFELAGKYLGADVVNINASTSSMSKGESLRDTLRTLEAMKVDAIILRHKAEGSAEYAAKAVKSVIINAGDGAHAHPSQALLDLFTIEQAKGRLAGLKIVIVGDILHSRVARSDIFAMSKMGMKIRLVGPKTLLPRFFDFEGVKIYDDIEKAVQNADVIYVLRIQLERQAAGLFPSAREYAKFFGVNEDRLRLAKEDVLLLHPGPQNKGLEISNAAVYSENSAIQDQVENGVAVRMALLDLTLNN